MANLIKELDKAIFKEKTAEIRIIPRRPEKEGEYIWYIPPGQSTGDTYEICKEIDEIIYREAQTYRHLLLGKNRPKRYRDLPPYTLENFLIALSAHEVRHRVQYLSQISLLSPRDKVKAKDLYLRALIEYEEILFEIEPPKTGDKEKEFDAKIIAKWAAKIWHESKDLSEIAKIIAEDKKTLLIK